MPRILVDRAPAGPALDAAVAAGCLSDYVVISGERHNVVTWIPEGWTPEDPPGGWKAGRLPPRYSTDIAVAWELVEDIKKSGWADFIDELEAGANSTDPFDVFHYLTPLTITRAYLKAKGVETIDIPD